MVKGVMLMCLLASASWAQPVPLPEEMESSFAIATGPVCDEMRLVQEPVPAGATRYRVRLGFRNSGGANEIVAHYIHGTETTMTTASREEYGTSYKPTAVCERTGYDNTIFVAGWNERLASVVVEEWVLSGARVLGPPITEGWEPDDAAGVYPSVTLPTVQRTLLFSCDDLNPILDMAFAPSSGELLLLERVGETERAVHAYAVGSPQARCQGVVDFVFGIPGEALASSTVPELSGLNSLWVGSHSSDGLFVQVNPWRTWRGIGFNQAGAGVGTVVLRDADRDGYFESGSAMTEKAFSNAHNPLLFTVDYTN